MRRIHTELVFGINTILSVYMLCFSGLLKYHCKSEPVIGIVYFLSTSGFYYFIFLLVMIVIFNFYKQHFYKNLSIFYLIPFAVFAFTVIIFLFLYVEESWKGLPL